jgi:polar amino acid transport system permease protein
MNAESCGVLGIALFGGAYMAETVRSGIEAVDKGQMEGALSLGFSPIRAEMYVILPQAVATSVPAFTANIIFLLKETSVFSAISLMDLMFTAKDLIGLYYKTTECLLLLVIFYLIILLPVSALGSVVEKKLRFV